MGKRSRAGELSQWIAGLDDADDRVRSRACYAIMGAADAGQDVGAALGALTRRLRHDNVLVWIAASKALRAAARQGTNIAQARVPLQGLVNRPPKLEDEGLVRELRIAALAALTHIWLGRSTGARGAQVYGDTYPELRPGIAGALREIAEAGRLKRTLVPPLVELLEAKEEGVATDALEGLRAFAGAGTKEATLVLGALARRQAKRKRPPRAARQLAAELEATGAVTPRQEKPTRAPAATPLDQLPPRQPRIDDAALEAMPRLTKLDCRAAERVTIATLSWTPPQSKDLLRALRFPNAVSISVWILEGRPLEELIRGAAALPRLQRLRLRGVETIPDEVALLRRLYDLELEGSGVDDLTTINPALGQLVELESLAIRHSAASELPAELCDLRALRRLTLSMFELRRLPARLARLERLEHVELDIRDRFDVDDALQKLVRLPSLRALWFRHEPTPARERLLARAGWGPGEFACRWVRG